MSPRGQTRHLETRARERRLARLATRQHGVVARRQLISIGFDENGIKLRLDSGRLHQLHIGVYAVGHARLSQHGRWLAAVFAYGDEALLSHRSAAALWGLEEPRSHAVDVTAPLGKQGVLRRPKIWIHRSRIDPEDRTRRLSIPVTTVARTLFDLAEIASFRRFESAWEEADRLELLDIRAVERVCERGFGRRALKPVKRLLGEAHPVERTRSQLEAAFASFCRSRTFPMPSFNAMALGFEVDALWPKQRVAAELDSWEFHHHRAAFERDRARDSALQAAGYRTIRVTHRRLHREPDTLASELSAVLGGV